MKWYELCFETEIITRKKNYEIIKKENFAIKHYENESYKIKKLPNFLNVKYEEYTGGIICLTQKNKRLRIVGKIINDDNLQLKKGKVEIPKSTKNIMTANEW